jgi:cyclopropane-fatty-acyl-phospholipid synthase
MDGTHYARTAEAWLQNLDRRRDETDAIFADTYGRDQVARRRLEWRLFFLCCAELFGYDGGREWGVSHYLFRNPRLS